MKQTPGNALKERCVDIITATQTEAEVRTEVEFGRTRVGRRCRWDVVAHHKGRALFLECKSQRVSGTAEEKVLHALDDVAAMPIPWATARVVWDGAGFSDVAKHELNRHPFAVHVSELTEVVCAAFGMWNAVWPKQERLL